MEARLREEREDQFEIEEEEVVRGRTVKKKFFMALASGFLMLGMLGAVFGISGVAFAMPIAGIGDFYVTFDKLEGKGFKFYAKLGETGNSDSAPMVRNKIETATVYGLHIYKDLKLPTGDWVRISIKASEPVKIQGLIQDARDIKGDFHFNKLALAEHNTDSLKEFTQTASTIQIKDAKIRTDYLFQRVVTLNGLHISVEPIEK